MNNKLKIITIALLLSGITGCDKNADVSANKVSTSATTKILEKLSVKSEPLKGYKTFDFGMPKEALLKVNGCNLTVQKSDEEQLVDALRGQKSFKPEITCMVDFMGTPTPMYPQFVNNQLKIMSIDLGVYEEDRYAGLANSLAEKYKVKETITEDQRTAFNSGALPEVAMVYAEGQVGLFIYNEKGVNYHDELGLTLDQSMQYATPTVTQKMLLQYVDTDQAKSILDIAAKGKTKSSDL